jgi:ABC-type enterochelin transport system permease subunit
MEKRHAVEAFDNSLRDILNKEDLPFGVKTVVLVETSNRLYRLSEKEAEHKLSILHCVGLIFGTLCNT